MNQLLIILFCIGLAGLIYINAGYPLVVLLLSRFYDRRPQKGTYTGQISLVIVAHNESVNLPRKIENLFRSTCADNIAEVLVGLDGADDNTGDLVNALGYPRVRVISFTERRGKPEVLNELIPLCQHEIVVLADARQEFEATTISSLLENFADPTVGVVSGELVFLSDPNESTAAKGIGFYWRFEKFIRKCESKFRGVPGATGACYAIRRELFRPIPAGTILDDVAIPMQAVMAGARSVFEPEARAYDRPCQSPKQESIRKRRTIAGAAQLILLFPSWLIPWKNPIWFEFVSHKLLRLVSPLLLFSTLATNIALFPIPIFRVFLMIQLGCYAAALVGWFFQKIGRRSTLFGPFLIFLTLNLTTAQALWDAFRSRYRVKWERIA